MQSRSGIAKLPEADIFNVVSRNSRNRLIYVVEDNGVPPLPNALGNGSVDGSLHAVVAAREEEVIEAEGGGISDVEVKETPDLTSLEAGE
jgi:hypothetical protein